MENNNLDHNDFDSIDNFAKNAFDNFEVEYDPMDWMDMQNKLRAESSIDQSIKKVLKDYKVPFNERDWTELEKQLENKEHLRPHIWWIKSTEVGVLALLIFSMFNLSSNKLFISESTENYDHTTTLNSSSNLSSNTSNNSQTTGDANGTKENTFRIEQVETNSSTTNNSIVDKNGPQAMLNTKDITTNNSNTSTSTTSSLTNVASKQHPTSDNQTNNKQIASKLTGSSSKRTTSSSKKASTNSSNNNVNDNSIVATNGGNSNDVPNQTNILGSTGKDGAANTSTVTTSKEVHSTALENNISSHSLLNSEEPTHDKYSTAEISVLDTKNGIKTTDPGFELKRLKLELPYNCRTYLGGAAVIGANFANSLGGTAIGYGLGFTIDSELSSRFALKSGIFFSYKGFELSDQFVLDKTAIDGNIYQIDQYKKSELVLIEIPLDVQFTFFKNEKWKIFATAGFSTNIIASKTDIGSLSTSYNGLSVSTDINANDFERGLFEGGQFTQNVFLTVGGGLGLERQLGDKISLYIMPVYRHAITPIGPDFMSSFNVTFGLRTSL